MTCLQPAPQFQACSTKVALGATLNQILKNPVNRQKIWREALGICHQLQGEGGKRA